MKSDIHPNYRPVVFKDKQADFAILTQSTINTKETIKWEDGEEYPVYYVDISSASHPFYTGKQQFVDTMGRVEKFKKKFAGGYKSLEKKAKLNQRQRRPNAVAFFVVQTKYEPGGQKYFPCSDLTGNAARSNDPIGRHKPTSETLLPNDWPSPVGWCMLAANMKSFATTLRSPSHDIQR